MTAPIRGHVAAKRYLRSVAPAYLARLSPGSVRSLKLQGAVLSPEAMARAQADPALPAAVAPRWRHDAAKVSGRDVPGLESWRDLLVRLLEN